MSYSDDTLQEAELLQEVTINETFLAVPFLNGNCHMCFQEEARGSWWHLSKLDLYKSTN